MTMQTTESVPTSTTPTNTTKARPRIVIIGAGFGGMSAAQKLKHADADVTVLDRTNHHLFQPLLYQVATASLAPTEITAPIRYILRKQKNTTVLLADVKKIDPERRIITIDGDNYGPSREIGYDYLIIATGARHAYFGKPEWEHLAPGLKTIEDARNVRSRFLMAFENAEKAETDEERRAWLTFVVVGGGPTGVELSGVIPEVAKKALHSNFRHIDTNQTQVILIEGTNRLLAAYPEVLGERAKHDLEKLGVIVRLGKNVTSIDETGVKIGDEFIPAKTVLWGAGNQASPLAKELKVPLDKAGRVIVEKDLSVPGHPEVFVVGDLATLPQKDGKPVPWVAQGAIQGGKCAARNVLAKLSNRPTEPFNYFNKGDMAVIGRGHAIAHIGKLNIGGILAWLMWIFIHILYLAGFRNRLVVLLEWGYSYLTYERGARLISNKEAVDMPVHLS